MTTGRIPYGLTLDKVTGGLLLLKKGEIVPFRGKGQQTVQSQWLALDTRIQKQSEMGSVGYIYMCIYLCIYEYICVYIYIHVYIATIII